MSRKPKKGYFVKGQFVAEGSELDQELKLAMKGGQVASKTDLKRESEELQQLGEQLLDLRADLFKPLPLPDKLADALADARRITNFEGKRRQMQFVGKLMRQLDPDALQSVRHALELQRLGHSHDTAQLHLAEQWRDRLIESDEAVQEWIGLHPGTDPQQLRALVRQARKDAPAADKAAVSQGLAPRQGRAYREIFQQVKATLKQADSSAATASEAHDA
ncbi:ribosome biogenesis factor YjgA [Limnohabitans sp.]|uniref:ribosome biogenesis factor YjgA n=1 Tax=Limnohabitans sp. TaxID=1907725 RepID=UPI00391BB50D